MKHLDKIIEELDSLEGVETTCYGIFYMGKQVSLSNGKSMWKKRNHATAALTNALSNSYFAKDGKRLYRPDFEVDNWGDITKHLIENKIVEIRKIS